MPRVQASILLPYWLKLGDGEYSAGPSGPALDLDTDWPRTRASIVNDQRDTLDPQEQVELNNRQAKQLLSLTNRLIRCYRAITHNTTIIELSLATASPFRFSVIAAGADPPAWETEITYKSSVPKPHVGVLTRSHERSARC